MIIKFIATKDGVIIYKGRKRMFLDYIYSAEIDHAFKHAAMLHEGLLKGGKRTVFECEEENGVD